MNKLPAGWQAKTVKDVCTLQNGNGFKPSEWSDTGLPIIRIQNLNGSKDFNYFSGKPKPSWLISPGEILFSWAGTKGISFGPFIWTGPQGVLNQHIFRTTPSDAVDKDWLYYSLKQLTFEIEGKAHGFKATLLHVSKGDIEGQKLLVPPRHEQIQIAKILATWDKAIATTERLLANSQQQKQALMQQLLTGKKRLSGFSQKWSQAPVSSCLLGSALRNSHYLLGLEDVMSVNKTAGIIPMREQTIGKSIERYKIVKPGWFAYNPMRINVGSICRWNGKSDCLVSPDYVVFQCDEGALLGSYFDQYRKSEPWASHMDNAGNGSVRVRIYLNDLAQLEIPLPPLPEQQKIAQVLATADAEIANLQAQLAKLRLEKKALMQQLLTGQRRVRLDAEAAA